MSTFLQALQNLLLNSFSGATCQINGASLYLFHPNFIGYVKISDRKTYAFFDQIFVAIAKQRQGIGSQVLAAIESAVKANSFTHIECYPTQGGILSGVVFFKAKGFTCSTEVGNWVKNV